MTGEGFTVWVTGPDARALEGFAAQLADCLRTRHLSVEIIDGSTAGLGDLDAEAAARAAVAAQLLARHGVASIVALPARRTVRDRARTDLGRMIEVLVPGDANAGYEPPERAEVEIGDAASGIERTVSTLEVLGLLPREDDRPYSEEEEREVIRRLKAFGYL